jgi:hypothetical protein
MQRLCLLCRSTRVLMTTLMLLLGAGAGAAVLSARSVGEII